MPFIRTTATNKVAKLDKRIRLLAGGMRASKTISVELVLIAKSQSDLTCGVCGLHGLQRGCRYLFSDDAETRKEHEEEWQYDPKLTSSSWSW